ncbi:hypothetical protein [Pediococcus pentosaceus]|uniref:hypothetical protein n=1 Tax=Pediococcus pentosaceus TaxID=1255 RepID=UPI0020BF30A6|nr:hypothetical protein [Pediococcus pentosaceus]MDQ7251907.1 hypothetical protein [Pediococcus pentosaceus]
MKLVKIDDYTYVNPESIGAIKDDYLGTNIYLTGSDKPIETSAEIKKVLGAICGSEEHLNGKDNLIKAVVDGLSGITDITKISVEYNRRNHEQPGGFQVHRR